MKENTDRFDYKKYVPNMYVYVSMYNIYIYILIKIKPG